MKKGNIITLNDDNEYRVLKISGSEAFVLAMYSINSENKITYGAKGKADFSGTQGLKYEGSNLDDYLENTWCPSLQTDQPEIYNTIKPRTIIQGLYSKLNNPSDINDFTDINYKFQKDSDNYGNLLLIGTVTVGERHAYILDIPDIFEYYGKNIITISELFKMNFNIESVLGSFFFRSAHNFAGNVWGMFSLTKTFCPVYTDRNVFRIQPAFVIDLAADGIEYTIQ